MLSRLTEIYLNYPFWAHLPSSYIEYHCLSSWYDLKLSYYFNHIEPFLPTSDNNEVNMTPFMAIMTISI